MKYTVRIAETLYEVQIEDIHARPVIVHVDGERFEVQAENEYIADISQEIKETKIQEMPKPTAGLGGTGNELTAPLPGTIVDVFVKIGDEVEVGNVVLVIEAMKMKNSIRSTCSGRIAEILVTVGQTVAHKQALVRFE